MLPVKLRPMRDLDTPLIFSSWLRSYRPSADPKVDKDVYYREHHKVVERLLREAEVVVATAEGDDDTVVGWVCSSPGVLHYVYVKEAFRRMGLGTWLLACQGPYSQYSHATRYGELLLKGEGTYNPYCLWDVAG